MTAPAGSPDGGEPRRGGSPSKTVATWLAVFVGALGLHRVYLHGWGDRLAWLHPPAALVGACGAWRMRTLGTDDRLGSALVPLLGIVLTAAMLAAIVYGLAPRERWQARFGAEADGRTGWPTVLGVLAAFAIGSTVAISTIVFVAQRAFEWTLPG